MMNMGNKRNMFHVSKKTRKTVARTLASIVAFCTTYALILPAITIDQETAEEDPGIVLTEDENVNALDTYTDNEEDASKEETIEETIQEEVINEPVEETVTETVQEETVSSDPTEVQETTHEETAAIAQEQQDVEEISLLPVANILEYESKDDYKITVKYDEKLGLTEKAELEIKEILKEDDYINYLEAFKSQYEEKNEIES